MKSLFPVMMIGLLLAAAVAGCGASSAATEPLEATATPTVTETESTASRTAQPTATPLPPTANPSSTPTASPTPTLTPIPTPTATPAPSLRQLTTNGCCAEPFFSPNSQQVLFIDKPGETSPVGVYGLDLAAPQPTPVLVNQTIGFRSPDRTIVAQVADNLVSFTNEETGQSWTVDTGGNWPHYSPDAGQILWVATDQEGPYDRRRSDIWLANLDGQNRRLLLTLYGAGFAGWFPDGERILLVGRDTPSEEDQTLFIYHVDSGQRTDLFTTQRLRGAEISAQGSWVIFFVAFADDPSENGIWVVNTVDPQPYQLELPNFGGYRWQDDNTLLLIPMRTSPEESMQLWAIDVSSGDSRPLTDPAWLSFSVSNGDWRVSPDGSSVVFVSSADQNIWLINLPGK